jgi:hypothetical protein
MRSPPRIPLAKRQRVLHEVFEVRPVEHAVAVAILPPIVEVHYPQPKAIAARVIEVTPATRDPVAR